MSALKPAEAVHRCKQWRSALRDWWTVTHWGDRAPKRFHASGGDIFSKMKGGLIPPS